LHWSVVINVKVKHLTFWCFGARCSVALIRRQRFKEIVAWMWGIQVIFWPFPSCI